MKEELRRALGVRSEHPRGAGEALPTKEALALCRVRSQHPLQLSSAQSQQHIQ